MRQIKSEYELFKAQGEKGHTIAGNMIKSEGIKGY
jgi:hypothetical protein